MTSPHHTSHHIIVRRSIIHHSSHFPTLHTHSHTFDGDRRFSSPAPVMRDNSIRMGAELNDPNRPQHSINSHVVTSIQAHASCDYGRGGLCPNPHLCTPSSMYTRQATVINTGIVTNSATKWIGSRCGVSPPRGV